MILQKNIKSFLFLFNVLWIFLTQWIFYWTDFDYESFIDRLTHQLASINILYVKVFQAFALNKHYISDEINQKLMGFTDHAPFTNDDIDYETLFNIENDYGITIHHNYVPMNSGMISLVFQGTVKENDKPIIIKIKRKNIDIKLEEAIDKLLFFVFLLFKNKSIFPKK